MQKLSQKEVYYLNLYAMVLLWRFYANYFGKHLVMYNDEGGTYLEDFISAIEFIPIDIRRNFDLIRELDRETIELNKSLQNLQQTYVMTIEEQLKKSFQPDEETNASNMKLLDEICMLRARVKERISHKIGIVQNMSTNIDNVTKKLDSDIAIFEAELKGCGEFETVKYLSPNTEVALKPPGETDIILGKVISYSTETCQYNVADVDDSKRYSVPDSSVFALDMVESHKKLMRGEIVYAIYPDTTSFYPATVVQATRRSAMNSEAVVIVQFHGDADETGVTPARAVLLKYVIRPPL